MTAFITLCSPFEKNLGLPTLDTNKYNKSVHLLSEAFKGYPKHLQMSRNNLPTIKAHQYTIASCVPLNS